MVINIGFLRNQEGLGSRSVLLVIIADPTRKEKFNRSVWGRGTVTGIRSIQTRLREKKIEIYK